MANGDFSTLTRRHGVKVNAGFPCSVEEVGLAVGEVVGHGSVKSAARMNSAVVLFLDQVEKANRVIETGIAINGLLVSVLPLTQPATKIVLSNVPPFIPDEFLSRELCVSLKRSCRAVNPLLRRVVSHRRQLYMILQKPGRGAQPALPRQSGGF
ncbi:hypothetical protein L3Q82_003693 [Scortum barcoo]|uniref:Uncharacterized protein n=1 Tax=Scortum barcoo TaxID=214431 RepID=A0ACB8X673_9TELE|nr:hypothetical protein L3Q82_003693 [Scortum barcoo]